jgi:hypothetical protein
MRGVRIVAAGLAAWALGACGILDEGDPEELTVELASDSAQEVLVVTSSDFVLMDGDTTGTGGTAPPPQVGLVSADTQSVSSPWSQGFDIQEGGRFFVEVQSPDSLSTTVTLTVRMDGSLLSIKELSAASSSVHFAYVLVR